MIYALKKARSKLFYSFIFKAVWVLAMILFLPKFCFSESLIDRFFKHKKIDTRRWHNRGFPMLPKISAKKVTPDKFNQAVGYNNKGLSAMRKKQYSQALNLFAKACKIVPSEKGFWNNRLLALQNLSGRSLEAIECARIILALDKSSSKASYLAGVLFLNRLNKPDKALPYLNYAMRLKPEDANIATAFASALEQAGYSGHAFEVLKKFAHKVKGDPYPFYLLGLEYLKREDYNPAIRALGTAKMNDKKGYAHDAYVRARYFAGQLEGLEQICRNVLVRFPNIINRKSLERILFSLEEKDFNFFETITVQVSDPDSLEKMDFLVKLPPSIENHQNVELIKSEVIYKNYTTSIRPTKREPNGCLRFELRKDIFGPVFHLRMNYRIKTQAWLGSQFQGRTRSKPDLRKLKADPKLSLEHPILNILYERLDKMRGNYILNAVKAISNGLKYKENFQDNTVKWAFANPDGCDCTEFSRLLAALCLKKGIPARVVTGFLVKPENLGKETSVGHAWCEVFFAGKGWVPIDPTLQPTMHWAYFGNLLTDQIVFNTLKNHGRTRVSVDFISTRPELQVKISNSYKISSWKN